MARKKCKDLLLFLIPSEVGQSDGSKYRDQTVSEGSPIVPETIFILDGQAFSREEALAYLEETYELTSVETEKFLYLFVNLRNRPDDLVAIFRGYEFDCAKASLTAETAPPYPEWRDKIIQDALAAA